MIRLYVSLVLLLYYFPAFGQVTFTQFPRDLQLYPRDANSQANVVVSGSVSGTGYTKISVQVLREGILTKTVSQALEPAATNATFTLSALIKAEPAEYSFRVYLDKGSVSTFIAERNRIVCGDVYIIHGQSNALALPELEELYPASFDDKYMRNVNYPYMGTPDQMTWYPAKLPFASVGGLGLTIQQLILKNYGIPTCVLNGAFGGADIDILSIRDPNNHANPGTYYGNLLNRAQWAGIAKQVKAIIWKQGEAEAGTGTPGYAAKFAALYNQFREDYGDARIYVGQINILSNPQDSAAALRDFQRRTKYLFKQVETVATVGTPGYGGVHYTGKANQQIAVEQYRLIARDIYGSNDTLQINSPDIKKAVYNAAKDSLTLVFDNQMDMVWTNDTTFYSFATGAVMAHREQKDYFYLDGKAGLVTGGSADGNRIILRLAQPASARTIRYLPGFFSDSASPFYDGPTLRNTRGMRAFSFDAIPIVDAIAPATALAAKPISDQRVDLSWTPSTTAQLQFVERSDGTSTHFKQLASLSGTATTYSDTKLTDMSGRYYYRIRSYTPASESPGSNVANVQIVVVLGVASIEPIINLYPNPLTTDQLLHITIDQFTCTDLVVRDMLGRVVKSWHGAAKNSLSLSVANLEAGLYVAELQTSDGHVLRRKMVVR